MGADHSQSSLEVVSLLRDGDTLHHKPSRTRGDRIRSAKEIREYLDFVKKELNINDPHRENSITSVASTVISSVVRGNRERGSKYVVSYLDSTSHQPSTIANYNAFVLDEIRNLFAAYSTVNVDTVVANEASAPCTHAQDAERYNDWAAEQAKRVLAYSFVRKANPGARYQD
jgi:hypothetical protein